MQTSAPLTETAEFRPTLAERTGTFPLIVARTPREDLDQRTTRNRAAFKAAPRRFTGEPLTGFGSLL